MIEIELTQNQITLVDDVDADLSEFNWYAAFKTGYSGGGNYLAMRKYSRLSGKRGAEGLHCVILSRVLNRPLERGEQVDHKNLNPLDNRRENLRLATHSNNMRNRGLQINNTSGFMGVTFRKKRNKYESQITFNGKSIHLGHFDDAISAANAYDEAARKFHGEFAVTNF